MKKKILSIALILIVFLLCGILSFSFFTIKKYDKLIYPNVHVENIPLHGLDIEKSKIMLHKNLKEKIYNKKLNILVEDEIYNTNYIELGVKFNIDKAVQEAFNYGKDFNIFKKLLVLIKPEYVNINLELTFNDKAIDGIIGKIESKTNEKAIDSDIKLINGRFEISEEIKGKKLDSNHLKKELITNINTKTDEEITIEAIVNEVIPKRTKRELSKINLSMTSSSTNFSSSSAARSTNIKIATETIDGTVMMPGEVFSFNDVVGERTYSKGYQRASVIMGDEFVAGLGGGICQVSTTLYNAVLKSELEIVERKPHSRPISYVPLGQDATINYGSTDFKFKNNLDYPIYIQGYIQNSNVAFNIYSNKEVKKRSYRIESKIEEVLKPKDRIRYDSNIEKGRTYVEKKGKIGYIVNVYKYVYEDGILVEKKLVSKDKYRAIDNMVRMGR
ncbi:VanW family protein [uncultured Clostridium sp.]|uniref:VanW family protein n=1 Tax=uncultured Clostridium sp. TaxID=59620 RepID=UPI002587A618|nr:VanW family protein [uncultured Clostridium sp.]MDU1349081.1 VanW family protein [Clostridium argentinense]